MALQDLWDSLTLFVNGPDAREQARAATRTVRAAQRDVHRLQQTYISRENAAVASIRSKSRQRGVRAEDLRALALQAKRAQAGAATCERRITMLDAAADRAMAAVTTAAIASVLETVDTVVEGLGGTSADMQAAAMRHERTSARMDLMDDVLDDATEEGETEDTADEALAEICGRAGISLPFSLPTLADTQLDALPLAPSGFGGHPPPTKPGAQPLRF